MITMENYEGWLMRYADGELTGAERAEAEAFLAEHPALREEMEAVAAVKVTPPVAVMPNRERLLRRTAVPVWGRVAAAVAVAVAALWLLMPTAEEPATVAIRMSEAEPATAPASKPMDTKPAEETIAPRPVMEQPATVAALLPEEETPDAEAVAELVPTEEPTAPLPTVQMITPLVIETDKLIVVEPTMTVTEGYVLDVQLTTTPMQTLVRGLLALKEE